MTIKKHVQIEHVEHALIKQIKRAILDYECAFYCMIGPQTDLSKPRYASFHAFGERVFYS